MILTGAEIVEQVRAGSITLEPFNSAGVNPNSYNYHLGSVIKIFSHFDGYHSRFRSIQIPQEGLVLEPGTLYLGHTAEIIGSSDFAMSLIGRSSLGRYGVFLQVSANLGHTGSRHRWTLELVAARRVKLYAGMVIGQVSFWDNQGVLGGQQGRYAQFDNPTERLSDGIEAKHSDSDR
jgi:dCTP deaminase